MTSAISIPSTRRSLSSRLSIKNLARIFKAESKNECASADAEWTKDSKSPVEVPIAESLEPNLSETGSTGNEASLELSPCSKQPDAMHNNGATCRPMDEAGEQKNNPANAFAPVIVSECPYLDSLHEKILQSRHSSKLHRLRSSREKRIRGMAGLTFFDSDGYFQITAASLYLRRKLLLEGDLQDLLQSYEVEEAGNSLSEIATGCIIQYDYGLRAKFTSNFVELHSELTNRVQAYAAELEELKLMLPGFYAEVLLKQREILWLYDDSIKWSYVLNYNRNVVGMLEQSSQWSILHHTSPQCEEFRDALELKLRDWRNVIFAHLQNSRKYEAADIGMLRLISTAGRVQSFNGETELFRQKLHVLANRYASRQSLVSRYVRPLVDHFEKLSGQLAEGEKYHAFLKFSAALNRAREMLSSVALNFRIITSEVDSISKDLEQLRKASKLLVGASTENAREHL